jgi:transcriptional regulator GlxA family with amidase domain
MIDIFQDIFAMLDFLIVVLHGSYATSVAATLDILHAAAHMAVLNGLPAPRWRVVSPTSGLIDLRQGLSIQAESWPDAGQWPEAVWVVPGLGIAQAALLKARMTHPDAVRVAQTLHAHVAQGGHVAASCSGVFLLQKAGLLSAKRVTTSWWLAAELAALDASCQVDADQMVCMDGGVHTAGAAFAQSDLMLHLLKIRWGPQLPAWVSRVLLLDSRQAQAPFIVPTWVVSGDALIARLQALIESSLPQVPTVDDLAEAVAMSSRTLARRVKAATGKTPLALVQSIRLYRARSLLERSRQSIESIAEQVGYSDATALRRLIRKSTGVRPSQLRR